ncbi:F-box only protein 21 [Hondaea fermentalgiana]|uniref:F-box only protein 21 n=1 Tax=Hondaea fermentalgiana TaxID=2315210 RepID=A0A2R5GCJ4_9STRA|nr:F-box only protein 21 [Hondaea fermentalgiana]|eukprot:GBG25484.1 F-box only protein 21 [Hondaea fermentalgiana]
MTASSVGGVLRRELFKGARELDTRIRDLRTRVKPTLKTRRSELFDIRETERFRRFLPRSEAQRQRADDQGYGSIPFVSITDLFEDAFPTDEAMEASAEAGFAALRAVSRRLKVYENRTYVPAKPDNVLLDIGNVFQHRKHGFRGVIVQWFTECPAGPDWIEQWGPFEQGPDQPFYRTLVDTHDRPEPFMTLAAQENLEYLPNPEGPEIDHPKIPEFFSDFEFGHFVLRAKMAWAFPEDW